MADDSDKTEEPSEHKLQDARKKGQVLKSQEVISTCGLLAAYAMLVGTGASMYKIVTDYTKDIWGQISKPGLEDFQILPFTMHLMGVILLALLPLLAGCFMMAIISNVAQVKFLFTTEPLMPTMEKINPISGVKKIFSMKSIVELLKQILKLSLIAYLCIHAVQDDLPMFQKGPKLTLEQTSMLVGKILRKAIEYVLGGMLVICILDYGWQYKQFMKQMRMSHQDMKDEYKETEGNPQVKGKIRQMMRQGAQQRMMEEVPQASAVVTNPTHLAIAIRYKAGEDQVPMVVAKGERIKAQQIKLLAEDNEIPIIENVELARTLFGACEVGQAIPAEMYKAVAEVLVYVMKLKKKKALRNRRNK
jgi:flagellar biosynthetic protein FlhB